MFKALSPPQSERYERDGVVFPLAALSAEEVLKFRTAVDELEARLGGKLKPMQVVQPHLHFRWAYDLALHPAVLDIVEDIIGPNILAHTSSIFCKHPQDSAFISWHQDGFYWELSAPRLVSAWIALSDSTIENGCMQVLRGTHKLKLPHREHRHQDNMLASGLTVEADVDEAKIINVILKAGQMSLHHVNIVHGSGVNRSQTKRVGVAVRYIAPEVSQRLQHHEVVLARGRDEYHNYRIRKQPPSDNIDEGIAAQAEFAALLSKIRETR